MSKQSEIRIMIADGSISENLEISEILDDFEEMHVVYETISGSDAITKCANLKPDVVIINSDIRDMYEIDLVKRLIEVHPYCQCIMLTITDDPQWSKAVLAAGARCILSKPVAPNDLCTTITEVFEALIEYINSLKS